MLKEERQRLIEELLKNNSVISNADILNLSNVTEMTIRRDLKEMEEKGLLVRIHGGAKSFNTDVDETNQKKEFSHIRKRTINRPQKKHVAQLIAKEINEGDTVFLGSGTTIEMVYDYLTVPNIQVVTNSMLVFEKFKLDKRYETILIGGVYRDVSASFHGTISDQVAENFHVQKAFISANGILNNNIYDAVAEEGLTQKIIFENAKLKYLAVDSSKFDKKDFYQFYQTQDLDFILTDNEIPVETLEHYRNYCKIMTK
ncbi:DeoR/GlpR family DNA-binding transcription regulator [Globicatella sulfidifaciens]|uniref:DeoR/GlpR family DNA-binding transcription regulator n=1 Tax=Globicatella sulfidifaciens TaxID=136093 RepID=UPI00288DE9EA|nr:DeoR/GlpR family DNA-binding transcription regulator [Globicatella sulfidifaciens]MDT2767595.1 DeoR/GlpR family DNA-binding transcription regulator [Globicatella sulfidifaciens]